MDTWIRAGVQLERIRQAELRSVDTQEAVRQIFGRDQGAFAPGPPASGLIDQQAWFRRLGTSHPNAMSAFFEAACELQQSSETSSELHPTRQSSRHDTRNHLPAVKAIDAEIRIRRGYYRIGDSLRHADQAGISEAHR